MTDRPGWDALARELDAWAAEGRQATFWWRDDDATRPCGELDRLLALTADQKLVIALAAIPAEADEALADRLARGASALVFVHGWSHRNLAPPECRKSEFPDGRPPAEALADLAAARRRIEALFGGRARPVLTPPWNRIDAALPARLPAIGYRGISRHGMRGGPWAAPGLAAANTHLDPVDWHGGQGFLGLSPLVERAVAHLARRRRGESDAAEATGLLTHHLRHDVETWAFVERFLQTTAIHPGVRWIGPDDAFGWEPAP